MKQTYQAPGEETAGIRNLVLIYNGYYEQNRGNWTLEEFLPYLLYQRRDGSFSERFFDGFLFLGLLGPQGGQFFEATDPLKASTWDDWNWYLEKTFSPGGDLAALRAAVLDARRMSGDNALRAKLVLMVPFPSRESFPGTEAQKEALRLYMEQMKERYQPFAASDALELCALYLSLIHI